MEMLCLVVFLAALAGMAVCAVGIAYTVWRNRD